LVLEVVKQIDQQDGFHQHQQYEQKQRKQMEALVEELFCCCCCFYSYYWWRFCRLASSSRGHWYWYAKEIFVTWAGHEVV
jgi:hypothetical protein